MIRILSTVIVVILLISFGSIGICSNIKVSKNTFLRAVNQREISTATADEGDDVRLLITEPFYVGENLVFAEGDLLVGEVEDIKLAVQGNNASMKIRIDKLVHKSGATVPINAYIWSKNKNILGGEETPPMYYDKVPHYTEWKFGGKAGVIQLAPSGMNYFGAHTVLKAGAIVNIVLMSDFVSN